MKNAYNVTYEAAAFGGAPGFNYTVTRCGRWVANGWSRGKKHHAEQMAREDIARREGRAA